MGAADGYYAKYGPFDILPPRLVAERKWHRQALDLEWAEAKLRYLVQTAPTVEAVGEAKAALNLVTGVRRSLEEAMAKKKSKKGGKKGC